MTVTIKNDDDFQKSVDIVSEHLQAITDFARHNNSERLAARIKFPRRYFKTVYTIKKKFPWLDEGIVKSNVSYHYMYLDTMRWIANFTDIYAVPKSMIFKNAIVAYASISECLIYFAAKKFNLLEGRTIPQAKKLHTLSVLSEGLVKEIEWLWNSRHNVHIHLVTEPEGDRYSAFLANRSSAIVEQIEIEINAYFNVS